MLKYIYIYQNIYLALNMSTSVSRTIQVINTISPNINKSRDLQILPDVKY
jgi:hypothetical protein